MPRSEESPYYMNPYTSGRQWPIQGSIRVGGPYKIPYNPMADNPGLMAMEAYRQAKAQRRAQQLEEAKYAASIAEMQGQYTPELQERVLQPMAQEAGLGDQLVGGLRRMFGSDTQQGYTRPFTVPGGLKTKYEREIEAENKKNELRMALEDIKNTYSRNLKEYEAGEAMKRSEFTAQKNMEGREFTAKKQKEMAEIREAGADRRTNIRETGADKRNKDGSGAGGGKVGSAKEAVLWKLMNGKELTPEEQYVLQFSGGQTPEELTTEAVKITNTIVSQQIENGEIPDDVLQDKTKYLDYVKQLTGDTRKMLQELSGSATLPKPAPKDDKRPSLDEIFK